MNLRCSCKMLCWVKISPEPGLQDSHVASAGMLQDKAVPLTESTNANQRSWTGNVISRCYKRGAGVTDSASVSWELLSVWKPQLET